MNIEMHLRSEISEMLLFKSLEIYEIFKENYVKHIEKDEFLSSCQSFSEDLIYHESLETICQSNTEIHKKSLSICLVNSTCVLSLG